MSATATETPVGIDVEQLHAFVVALRNGDFTARLPVIDGAPWRVQEIAMHLNRHIEQMARMCAEFTRVAEEVGTQGRLGPQADVWLGGGPWKQMLEAVNGLAANLTNQLRDFNRSVNLIAKGDCSRPVTVPCEGETLELKNGINAVQDRLGAQLAPTQ
jgi:methyl-accepting chemotaxis protein